MAPPLPVMLAPFKKNPRLEPPLLVLPVPVILIAPPPVAVMTLLLATYIPRFPEPDPLALPPVPTKVREPVPVVLTVEALVIRIPLLVALAVLPPPIPLKVIFPAALV